VVRTHCLNCFPRVFFFWWTTGPTYEYELDCPTSEHVHGGHAWWPGQGFEERTDSMEPRVR